MLQPLLNYAGIALGLLGIVATICFAVRYAKRKDPRIYALTEQKIATSPDDPEGIEIRYRGANVDRISSTLIWFWNAGNEPIRAADFPPAQPLEIRLSDVRGPLEVLDVAVRKVSRPAINLVARKEGPSGIRVTLDFLDRGDGACIEVQHTGSRFTRTTASGVVLGAPRGVRVTERTGTESLRLRRPVAGRRGGRQRARRTAGLAVVALGLLVAATYLAARTRNDITSGVPQLREALAPYLNGTSLESAVNSVVEHSKYRAANRVAPYVIFLALSGEALALVLSAWRRRGYPAALQLEESPRERPAGAVSPPPPVGHGQDPLRGG